MKSPILPMHALYVQFLSMSQHKPLGRTQSMSHGVLLRRMQKVSSTMRSSGLCLLQTKMTTSPLPPRPSNKKAMPHPSSSLTSSLPWSTPFKYVPLQQLDGDSGATKSEQGQVHLVSQEHAILMYMHTVDYHKLPAQSQVMSQICQQVLHPPLL